MAFAVGSVALIAAGVAAAGTAYAADKAAKTQGRAASSATQLQQNIYDQNQENLSPYIQQGTSAGTQLSSMLSPGGALTSNFTGADYLANKDPGYDFQLAQGQQALQNSQAAGNGVLTGSAMKDLINYNQGVAATGYQNAFNRWQTQNTNTYNRLLGVSQLGENAAAGAGNTGATIGSNIANAITGGANASAAGTVGVANALSSGLSNGAGYYYLSNSGSQPNKTTLPVSSNDPYGYGSGQDLIAQFGG